MPSCAESTAEEGKEYKKTTACLQAGHDGGRPKCKTCGGAEVLVAVPGVKGNGARGYIRCWEGGFLQGMTPIVPLWQARLIVVVFLCLLCEQVARSAMARGQGGPRTGPPVFSGLSYPLPAPGLRPRTPGGMGAPDHGTVGARHASPSCCSMQAQSGMNPSYQKHQRPTGGQGMPCPYGRPRVLFFSSPRERGGGSRSETEG